MIKTTPLPKTRLQLNPKQHLDLSKPNIMGILNVTPDSFSDGGKHNSIDTALKQCEHMVKSGASIIDIGGESTRPNAPTISNQQEQDRVLPIVEAIKKQFDIIISIDTSSPSVIEQAHNMGAHIWNDVRALKKEHALEMAVKLNIPIMMMHMRGEPNTMMDLTQYNNVVEDVKKELMARVDVALTAGVSKQNIIVDVGFGFAKTAGHNYQLLKNLTEFHELGFPLMIGLSRKRMLADALTMNNLESDIEARIPGGIVASMLAVQQGVSIIRTHDVLQTAQGLAVLNALNHY